MNASSCAGRRVAHAIGLGLALSACSAPSPAVVVPAAPTATPRLAEAPVAPAVLPDLDVSFLSARERLAFDDLVRTLIAPCADTALPLEACVRDERACAACRPAARLLAQKIHQGATKADATAIYGKRFGPAREVNIGDSPVRGAAAAKVTVVVWSDFECPACKRMVPFIEGAVSARSADTRLVHKMYPLSQHPRAEPAARAAIAAQLQGKYWEMEELLFRTTALEDADLEAHARSLGLDVIRFQVDMASARVTKRLEADRKQAEDLGLTGTPFVMVNGREFDLGFFSPTELDAWLATDAALATSGASQ
jgi:protein-disulfide isomerase